MTGQDAELAAPTWPWRCCATVVADGFWSVEQICTKRYQDACEKAGLGS